MATVSVNIVTWNSRSDISSCLQALYGQTLRDFEVMIVDNASTDGTPEFAEHCYPEITIVRNKVNEGFCKAHNQAIKLSSSLFVLPLNPDVLMNSTYLQEMVDAINVYRDAGIVVGKLYLSENRLLDGTGLFVSKSRRQYLRGHGCHDFGEYDECQYIFGADGAAPLYRRSMLEDIKIEEQYFDEDFSSHKEDLDLAWRAQLFGWKCVYTPRAVAYHDRSFRPGSRRRMSEEIRKNAVKNRYLTLLKNEFLVNYARHLPWILMYDLKIIAYICLFERSSASGIWEFLRLMPSALEKRRYIMNHKRVKAKYIRSLIE